MSLSAIIKSMQDIMRKDSGVDGDAQRISQLAWMIFLKIYDDREEEREMMEDHYHSPIPEKMRWRNWASVEDKEAMTGDTLLDFINNQLFPTLKNLQLVGTNTRGSIVRAVFEDAYNYMKNGTLIRQVINKLNEIDFNDLIQKRHFGEIYEKILKDLQSSGNAGEFYTPRAVTQFMTDMLDPKLGESILDPACGTGGFLACTIDHIRKKYVKTADDEARLQRSIRGFEKKQLPHMLCITNMLLHNIDVPATIEHGNTLSRPLIDWEPEEYVDLVLTNPPFGGNEEDGIEQNFPATFRTRETADLFLILILRLLKEDGRCAIVLPDGTLFGEGVKTKIKEKLLTECNLHTIVRLPNGVFNPYTGIKTNLLFFEKGRKTEYIWYFEHPYPEGVVSYNKTKPIHISEFDLEKAWWTNREESEQAWKVSVDEIIKNNYNLDIKNPNKKEEALGDSHELLENYQKLQAEIQQTRNTLKESLVNALMEAGRLNSDSTAKGKNP